MATLSFDGQKDEIEIPRHWLDQPSPYFHAELWQQSQLSLSKNLQELGETRTQSYSQHVRALLRTSEPPLPDLGQVACNLHVSERTLNRRLQAESSSFRQLKSEALANWAKIYLDQTEHSVESIAATLGYKDTANFRRAFRKSTHSSPNEYRFNQHETISMQDYEAIPLPDREKYPVDKMQQRADDYYQFIKRPSFRAPLFY